MKAGRGHGCKLDHDDAATRHSVAPPFRLRRIGTDHPHDYRGGLNATLDLFLNDGHQPLDAAHAIGLRYSIQALQERLGDAAPEFHVAWLGHAHFLGDSTMNDIQWAHTAVAFWLARLQEAAAREFARLAEELRR